MLKKFRIYLNLKSKSTKKMQKRPTSQKPKNFQNLTKWKNKKSKKWKKP